MTTPPAFNQIALVLYPTLETVPPGYRVRVYRHDVLLAEVASGDAAFVYLANHADARRGMADVVSHALRFDGYRCEPVVCPACVAYGVRFTHRATGACDCPKCYGYCRCVLS